LFALSFFVVRFRSKRRARASLTGIFSYVTIGRLIIVHMLLALSGQIANCFKMYERSDLAPLRAAVLADRINVLIFPAVEFTKLDAALF